MIKQYQPNIPMLRSGLVAKHLARFAVTVDFPTPPLPDNTRTCRKTSKTWRRILNRRKYSARNARITNFSQLKKQAEK